MSSERSRSRSRSEEPREVAAQQQDHAGAPQGPERWDLGAPPRQQSRAGRGGALREHRAAARDPPAVAEPVVEAAPPEATAPATESDSSSESSAEPTPTVPGPPTQQTPADKQCWRAQYRGRIEFAQVDRLLLEAHQADGFHLEAKAKWRPEGPGKWSASLLFLYTAAPQDRVRAFAAKIGPVQSLRTQDEHSWRRRKANKARKRAKQGKAAREPGTG